METVTLSGLLMLAALSTAGSETEMSKRPAYDQYAQATCSLSNQQRSGIRKICYYDCGGAVRTLVVPVAKTCPFTIKR
ncbi:MAG: hypothetical protein JJ937_01935 [Parvibaculum sp.]|jgi:hypothetical protein|nr:hypothetical protein [Parvibaculum sp.]